MSTNSDERKRKYSLKTRNFKRKAGSGFNNPKAKRHERVLKQILDTKGMKPVGEIMREEGYKETYAKNPQILMKTKSWEDLVEEFIPEEMILKGVKEGINANKQFIKKKVEDGKVVEEIVEFPDMAIRHKFTETALKARGKIGGGIIINNNNNIGFSLADVASASEEVMRKLKRDENIIDI